MKSIFHGWNSGAPMISTKNKSTPNPQILWKRKLSKRTKTKKWEKYERFLEHKSGMTESKDQLHKNESKNLIWQNRKNDKAGEPEISGSVPPPSL